MQISQIWIYPIKSLSGISLQSAKIEGRGFQYDRRWMLVDENGRLVTQREFKEMALLQPILEDGQMKIVHKTKEIAPLTFSLTPPENEQISVSIWKDSAVATLMPNACHQWFSGFLGASVRLVFMAEKNERQINRTYAAEGENVSFADGYPYLILGESAMDFLNKKLKESVPINRFRANIIFTGGEPHCEDSFGNIQIRNTKFRVIKPCIRCQIPNIEQETAIIKKEPNRTLAIYRKAERGIIFGVHTCLELGQENESLIMNVGDNLTIHS